MTTVASAGAAFTPSPTIAVNLPSDWSCLTARGFVLGQHLGEDAFSPDLRQRTSTSRLRGASQTQEFVL